jgi:hypothetical protein
VFAGAGVELVVWFLAFRHTINNWMFAILTGALIVALPYAASIVSPSASRRTRVDDDRDATPLELIGIDRDFTAEDLREIDRVVGLDRSRA